MAVHLVGLPLGYEVAVRSTHCLHSRSLVAALLKIKKKTSEEVFFLFGARSWTRTNDPLINSQVL